MSEAIRLDDICKTLSKREILKNISFSIEPGDIFGYLGPNGAGKTTTIRILLGLLQPTTGTALILDRDVGIDEIRRKVGFVLESDGLYDSMTAYENLQYYAQIFSVSQSRKRIYETLKLVNLENRDRDKVSTYSRGMRQRLALARAMVHNPEILVLDEPTAGVDPSGQVEVRQIMLHMAHQEGKTIFLSSHNLDEVQRICNRIALIDRGQIKLCGELNKLQVEMSRREVLVETAEIIASPVLVELRSLPGVSIQAQTDRTIILSVDEGGNNVSHIVSFLTQRGIRIEQVKRREASLEEIYTVIVKEAEEQ